MNRRHWWCRAVCLALLLALGVSAHVVVRGGGSAPAFLCHAYDGRPLPRQGDWRHGMRWIEGGSFIFGSDRFYPEEGRAHRAEVSGFWIDVHPVTNAQFAAFIAATGYQTRAERGIDRETDPDLPAPLREPGAMVFQQGDGVLRPGWRFVAGANWRHPEGAGSDLQGRANHPVVQVTYEDALAYAQWSGRELPSEAQWEYAARGGLEDADFSWQASEFEHGRALANTWQGQFPYLNLATDGFTGTSPVGCFPANGFGIFDSGGNVWELTRTWYRPGHDAEAGRDPEGPAEADSIDPLQGGGPVKVIKGGSHLCSADACMRYRPSARQPQLLYLGTSHVGFRTSLPKGEQPRRLSGTTPGSAL